MSQHDQHTDIRRAAMVFGGWLVGASLISGIGRALQIGDTLQTFGGASYMPGIVAIEALQVRGAHVAVVGSALGVFVGLHGRRRTVEGNRPFWFPWLLFALAPVAGLAAATLVTLCGAAVFVHFFSGTWTIVSTVLQSRLLPHDALVGLARGGVFACLIGVGARWVFPVVARQRWRNIWKYVAVFAMVRGAMLLIDPLFDLVVDRDWRPPSADASVGCSDPSRSVRPSTFHLAFAAEAKIVRMATL